MHSAAIGASRRKGTSRIVEIMGLLICRQRTYDARPEPLLDQYNRRCKQVYQQATQVMLSQQNIAGATAAARRYVTQYSRSPIAHFLLGSALASGGVRDDALRAMETAITLYEQDPKPDLAPIYEAMKSTRERLAG